MIESPKDISFLHGLLLTLEIHTTTTITLVHDCKIYMVYCDINYKLNIACEQKESKRKFL